MGLPRRTRSHVRSTMLTQDHIARLRATCPPSSAGFAAWVFCDRLRPGPLAETLGSNERRTRQHRSAARCGQRPGIAACQSQLAAGSWCARPRCSGARRPCSAATAAAAGRPTGSATRVTRVEGFVRAASPGPDRRGRRAPRCRLRESDTRELRCNPDHGARGHAGLDAGPRELSPGELARLLALVPPEAGHARKYRKSHGLRKARKPGGAQSPAQALVNAQTTSGICLSG